MTGCLRLALVSSRLLGSCDGSNPEKMSCLWSGLSSLMTHKVAGDRAQAKLLMPRPSSTTCGAPPEAGTRIMRTGVVAAKSRLALDKYRTQEPSGLTTGQSL